MTGNFYTIRSIADYFNRIVAGSSVTECFTQEKGKLVIMLSGCRSGNALEFSADRKYPYLILRSNFTKASKNAAVLFSELAGSEISSAELLENDRAIGLNLNFGISLCFTFFASPNCFVVSDGVIKDMFKQNAGLAGFSFRELFTRRSVKAAGAAGNAGEFLRDEYPHLGELYRREVLCRAKLSEKAFLSGSAELNLKEQAELLLKEAGSRCLLYSCNNEEPVMSLCPLTHLSTEPAREFEDVNSLVSYFSVAVNRQRRFAELKKARLTSLEKALKEAERKCRSLETQIANCGNSDTFRMYGEIILADIRKIERGQTSHKFDAGDGQVILIRLKPELSAAQNAGEYFEKYKRQKASIDLLRKKLCKSISDADKIRREIDNTLNTADLKRLGKEAKLEEKKTADETARFRKFLVSHGYEVWVGKDSASNDLLTTRYSAQNDLWFHVRGASGSHTVLKASAKKESVPKEAIETAAAIAAYYSKARNAGNVPVAYCERKHVKKKKGLKQGAVIMEKEKVIYVKPGLPENN